MKKLFNVLAVIAIALGFASCKDKKEVDPYAKFTIDLKASGITSSSADIVVTPADTALTYLFSYVSKESFIEDYGQLSDSAIIVEHVAMMDQIIEYYGQYGMEVTYSDFLSKGKIEDVLEDLEASTTYVMYAFYLNEDGTTTVPKLYKYEFTTAEYVAPTSVNFTINVSDVTSSTATVSVDAKPSDAYFYFDIVSKSNFEYLGSADAAAEYILSDLKEQLSAYGYTLSQALAQGSDNYTYESLEGSTEYVVIAFGVNPSTEEIIGQATTKSFTTSEASLTDEYPTTLESNATITPAGYIGYASAGSSNGVEAYYIGIMDAAETSGCQFYIVANQGAQIFGQTYTIDLSNSFAAGTAIPGYISNNYLMGSWYYNVSASGQISAPYCALTSGTIAFAQNGENVTITINAQDVLNHTVSGSATLPVQLLQTSAPAKTRAMLPVAGRKIVAQKEQPKFPAFKVQL